MKIHFLKTLLTITKNTITGGLRDNICFIHIPKCAGTSLNHAIRQHYLSLDHRSMKKISIINSKATAKVVDLIRTSAAIHDFNDVYFTLKCREHLLLYYMSQDKVRYIAGHFTFSELAYEAFHNKYFFITLLRDPVKRYISSYFYNKHKKPRFNIEDDVRRYIESDFGKSQGYEYVKFLGGADACGDYCSERAVRRAKENLKKIGMVGVLEFLDQFIVNFKTRFGVKLNLERRNVSPEKKDYQNDIITEDMEDRIRMICKPDLEIYQHVIAKFVEK